MLSCCLKCRKNTEIKNSKVRRKKKTEKIMLYQNVKCVIKSKFIKEQQASGFLISSGIKILLGTNFLLRPLLV